MSYMCLQSVNLVEQQASDKRDKLSVAFIAYSMKNKTWVKTNINNIQNRTINYTTKNKYAKLKLLNKKIFFSTLKGFWQWYKWNESVVISNLNREDWWFFGRYYKHRFSEGYV